MDFRLLGAVEAWSQDRQFDLGPRKQRFVFAVLALNVNQLVSVDRLVDLTWPIAPPRTAHHAIHVRVSQLRARLAQAGSGPGEVDISTHGSAYLLRANPLSVDVYRFRAAVARARTLTDDIETVGLLRHALGMWHGPPLADVAPPEVAGQLCHSLEETRLVTVEECLDAELRLGRHNTVIDELTELIAQHPYRQRLLAQLMLSLYRAGRAADALSAYKRNRSRLIDELALDPEPQLRRLENAILCADPALDVLRPRLKGVSRPSGPHPDPDDAKPARPSSPEDAAASVTVEACQLSKWFGSRAAVDGLSFTARQGEVVGLLGPNGAGKTTTIRLLSTVLPPTSGEFSVAGIPFTRPAEIRRRVGVLPESGGYPGHQTGREYLRYHARLFGLPRSQAESVAERLLAEVGLAERASSRISTYSRGMRQRLGIARALVHDPAVVLLDEPTLGLDPAGQRQVLAIVRDIAARRGATVVLSTHTLPEVEEVCTTVLILDKGKVLTSGTVGEVTHTAAVRRSGRLRVPVDLVDRARRALAGVAGVSANTNDRPDVIMISLTEPTDGQDAHTDSGMNAALRAVLTAGVPIISYDPDGARPSENLVDMVTPVEP